jgi:hypothetical protein
MIGDAPEQRNQTISVVEHIGMNAALPGCQRRALSRFPRVRLSIFAADFRHFHRPSSDSFQVTCWNSSMSKGTKRPGHNNLSQPPQLAANIRSLEAIDTIPLNPWNKPANNIIIPIRVSRSLPVPRVYLSHIVPWEVGESS